MVPQALRPGRSLALPRAVKARIGRNPRVITDAVWARLLWAGLHLEAADLPDTCNTAYPVRCVRALAVVWLFAGLRSDEILRLRVGCVRWQSIHDAPGAEPVCLLDIPIHKTGTDGLHQTRRSAGRPRHRDMGSGSSPAAALRRPQERGTRRVDVHVSGSCHTARVHQLLAHPDAVPQGGRKWPEIFNNDATPTSAILDRLLHHAENHRHRGQKLPDEGRQPPIVTAHNTPRSATTLNRWF